MPEALVHFIRVCTSPLCVTITTILPVSVSTVSGREGGLHFEPHQRFLCYWTLLMRKVNLDVAFQVTAPLFRMVNIVERFCEIFTFQRYLFIGTLKYDLQGI